MQGLRLSACKRPEDVGGYRALAPGGQQLFKHGGNLGRDRGCVAAHRLKDHHGRQPVRRQNGNVVASSGAEIGKQQRNRAGFQVRRGNSAGTMMVV